MYDAMRWWRLAACGSPTWAACGPDVRSTWSEHVHHTRSRGGFGTGAFGVRRPLRFLAWKLDLSDDQLAEVARILGELKTERAQAEVDRARTLAAFADSLGEASFDAERARQGAALRVASAERLRDARVNALEALHRVLDPEQRKNLAVLIRTGTVSL